MEKYWISLLAGNLNKDLSSDISVDISFLRKGSDIRQLELSLSNSATVVAGPATSTGPLWNWQRGMYRLPTWRDRAES
jgi:hypothetical protein